MDILSIKHLSKGFGTHKVIDDLTFAVPEHSVFGFIGQNGAGKTTTMKMILGLLKPDGGEITVCGEKVSYGQTGTNRFIGYLPDVPEFYGYMKPMEYLRLCGEITGLKYQQIRKKSEELLELVGLDKVNRRIGGFSRGMKQRLGIAQALINEPKLLVCDEPTSALDPVGRKEILDILQQVKSKTTVIFSTHILSDVERICDNIAVLHEGKLALYGTLSAIKSRHRQDGVRVEFFSEEDRHRFVQAPQLKPFVINAEQNGTSITLHVSDVEKAAGQVLSALYENGLVPVRFEILEPTLESLFMEVIA